MCWYTSFCIVVSSFVLLSKQVTQYEGSEMSLFLFLFLFKYASLLFSCFLEWNHSKVELFLYSSTTVINIFIYSSIYLFLYSFIHLFIYSSIHPFIHPSITGISIFRLDSIRLELILLYHRVSCGVVLCSLLLYSILFDSILNYSISSDLFSWDSTI